MADLAPNADRFYSVGFLVYNMDKPKNYHNFLDGMRRLPRANFNKGELTSEDLTNLILKYNGKKVVLKLCTYDFFAYGFVANDGTLWEFRLETDVPRLRGSRAIGIRVNYPTLVGLRISKKAIVKAFGELAGMVQGKNIAKSSAIICLVFCEGARFSWVGDTFRRYVSSNEQWMVVEMWLEHIVKNWANLTSLARECDEEDIVLTEIEEKVVARHDYSYFCKGGAEARRSQARIAKLLIKVLHKPQENS